DVNCENGQPTDIENRAAGFFAFGATGAGGGIFGDSTGGSGISGGSDSGNGVFGGSDSGVGVNGRSNTNFGLFAYSDQATGGHIGGDEECDQSHVREPGPGHDSGQRGGRLRPGGDAGDRDHRLVHDSPQQERDGEPAGGVVRRQLTTRRPLPDPGPKGGRVGP